jgi:hypothetical protein
MRVFRGIYKYFVSLMALAIVVQIGLAGFGAFDTADKLSSDGSSVDEKSFENSFGPHAALGTFIVLSGLLLLLFSFGTRDGRRMKRSGIIFGLLVLQLMLAWTGASVPFLLGALHPLNAFLILAVVGTTAYREWKPAVEESPEVEAAPAPAAPSA